MSPSVTIETITPERAQELLQNPLEGQRHVRKRHAERLSEEILHGRFRLSCDAIVIVSGKLANGQHRLSAVVIAGRSVQFLVLRTNDADLFKVIDSGVKRTVGDVLGVPSARHIAAMANIGIAYDRNLISATGFGNKTSLCTRSEIVDYANVYMDHLQEAAGVVDALYQKYRLLNRIVGASFLYLASRSHKQRAVEFVTQVYTGEGTPSAALDIRDRLIKNACSIAKLKSPYLLAMMIKALKSYLQGTRPARLGVKENEEYPRL